MRVFLTSLFVSVLPVMAIGQTLQGTLLDAACPAIGAGTADMPRGTASATATGPGSGSAYGSMGTTGAGSQSGMSGTSAGAATTRKTEKALDNPRATATTATGAGTSGAYASDGVAGSNGPATPSAQEGESQKYQGCQVGATTTAFAVQTGTGVILLDEASNKLVKTKLKTATWKANRSPSVTLQGKLSADRFAVRSVKAKL